eukprot:scaffold300904_cov26-Tisochrysis_lutea.AAC.1
MVAMPVRACSNACRMSTSTAAAPWRTPASLSSSHADARSASGPPCASAHATSARLARAGLRRRTARCVRAASSCIPPTLGFPGAACVASGCA